MSHPYPFLFHFEDDGTSHYYPPSEPEQETNEVERQTTQTQETQSNARIRPDSTRTEHLDANEIINTQQMCKNNLFYTFKQRQDIMVKET